MIQPSRTAAPFRPGHSSWPCSRGNSPAPAACGASPVSSCPSDAGSVTWVSMPSAVSVWLGQTKARQPRSSKRYSRSFWPAARSLRRPDRSRFKDSGKLSLLDASVIELPLFLWASCRSGKEAMKLHAGLSIDGYLPSFVNMAHGDVHEIKRVNCGSGWVETPWPQKPWGGGASGDPAQLDGRCVPQGALCGRMQR